MTELLLRSLAVSLTLTLALELLFARLRGFDRKQLGLCALVNLATNPAAVTLHFLVLHFTVWPVWPAVLVLEALVVLAEGLCYRNVRLHPWRFSLCINLWSYGMGLGLQFLRNWII